MPKFYSSFNRPPSKAEPKCPREKQDYILDEQTNELVPTGKINFYERIQSYHDSSTLSAKLKRFSMGDTAALGTPYNCDVDLTNISADLRQIVTLRKNSVEKFSDLPVELRQLFGYSYDEFEASVTNGTADKRITEYLGKLAESKPGQQLSTEPVVDPGKSN